MAANKKKVVEKRPLFDKDRVIWVAGRPAAGKTTLMRELKAKCFKDDKADAFDLDDIMTSVEHELKETDPDQYKRYLRNEQKAFEETSKRIKNEIEALCVRASNAGKWIVFVGLYRIDEMAGHKLYIDIPIEVMFRRRLLRELDTIVTKSQEFKQQIEQAKDDELDVLALELRQEIHGCFTGTYKYEVAITSEIEEFYRERGFTFVKSEMIFEFVCGLINGNIVRAEKPMKKKKKTQQRRRRRR